MVILYFSSWGKISPGHDKNKFSNMTTAFGIQIAVPWKWLKMYIYIGYNFFETLI